APAQVADMGMLRRRGLFRGIELVEDRSTKTPFDPAAGINKKIKKAAFEAGLICYPMGGTIDGVRGDHILLAPPFILEDTHVSEIVDKLDTAFKSAFR
ncbi:MAG: aspartate aminotransferase family protein, partial [Pseudomonadota bacterium]